MEKLKCICNKIIPLVYEESLSYYELLCKVVEKVNIIIDFYNMYSDEWKEEMFRVVTETLNEWLEDGTFDEMVDRIMGGLSHLVFINAWGAKGDGITDDTAAIQNAIDNNPYSIFIFHGTYKVTDTINLKFGTQTLFLSDIRYSGPTGKPVFKLNNGYYDGYSYGGGPLIEGGCISGLSSDDTTMDCAIQVCTTSARINNVHIRNYNKYGILLGDDFENPRELTGSNMSSAALINNCVITNFPKVKGTAICMRYTDIKISNCNINGALHGIDYFGGNLFLSNTHITPTVGTEQVAGSCCIYVHPNPVTGNMNLNLTGDYFNGVPESIITVAETTSHILNMNGCSMIMGAPTNSDTIYIMNGNQTKMQFMINDIKVRASDETRILMYPDYSGSFKDLNNSFTISNTGSNQPINVLDVRAAADLESPHIINSATHSLDAQKMLVVGSLISVNRTSIMQKFILNVGNTRLAEFYVSFDENNVYAYGYKYGNFGSNIKLLVGSVLSSTIEGNTYYRRSIYLGNNGDTSFGGTPVTLSCVESRNDPAHRVHLFRVAANSKEDFTRDINTNLYDILENLTQM